MSFQVQASRKVFSALGKKVSCSSIRSSRPSRIGHNRVLRSFSCANPSTMDLIKDLRATSGAPIVDCKKALSKSNNDMQLALDWLREHGAAKVSSKVGDRVAKEGLVGLKVSTDGKSGAIVQVASETDFAGRSTTFVDLVMFCADAALQTEHKDQASGTVDVSELLKATNGPKTVEEAINEAIVAIRENLSLSKATSFTADGNGVVVGYVHGRILPSNAGSAAAIVELAPLEGQTVDNSELQEAGKKLAMHIVAAKPQYLSPQSIPTEVVEAEREILVKQIADSKKPPEIMDKIVEGRLRKFYESCCLLEQNHMIEEENPSISKNLKQIGIQVNRFALVSIA